MGDVGAATAARARAMGDAYKKRAIPQATRRAVALRAGAPGTPGTRTPAACHYCGSAGVIHWMTISWVYFERLHLDHVIPELLGGSSDPSNIVLACRRCNLRKGWRRSASSMRRE